MRREQDRLDRVLPWRDTLKSKLPNLYPLYAVDHPWVDYGYLEVIRTNRELIRVWYSPEIACRCDSHTLAEILQPLVDQDSKDGHGCYVVKEKYVWGALWEKIGKQYRPTNLDHLYKEMRIDENRFFIFEAVFKMYTIEMIHEKLKAMTDTFGEPPFIVRLEVPPFNEVYPPRG